MSISEWIIGAYTHQLEWNVWIDFVQHETLWPAVTVGIESFVINLRDDGWNIDLETDQPVAISWHLKFKTFSVSHSAYQFANCLQSAHYFGKQSVHADDKREKSGDKHRWSLFTSTASTRAAKNQNVCHYCQVAQYILEKLELRDSRKERSWTVIAPERDYGSWLSWWMLFTAAGLLIFYAYKGWVSISKHRLVDRILFELITVETESGAVWLQDWRSTHVWHPGPKCKEDWTFLFLFSHCVLFSTDEFFFFSAMKLANLTRITRLGKGEWNEQQAWTVLNGQTRWK